MKSEVAFRSFAKISRVEIFFSGRDSASAVKNSSKIKGKKKEKEAHVRCTSYKGQKPVLANLQVTNLLCYM